MLMPAVAKPNYMYKHTNFEVAKFLQISSIETYKFFAKFLEFFCFFFFYTSDQKKAIPSSNHMIQDSFKDPLPPPPTDLFGQAPF